MLGTSERNGTYAGVMEVGWGADSLKNSGILGIAKIEYGVFRDDELIHVFRTDCDDFEDLVKFEAQKHAEMLEREDIEAKYTVRRI